MNKVRVLIVDDSAAVRRLLSAALADDPGIEVVGTAANGRIALAKIPRMNPDLVVLDQEMSEMDGQALPAELRKTHPQLPVILFHAQAQDGAVAVLNARLSAAIDEVKQSSGVDLTAAIRTVRDELVPKIKSLCRDDKPTASCPPRTAAAQPRRGELELRRRRFDVIAIGVSTGGPNALAEIFRKLPSNLPVPIVIVQHMPPLFTGYLAERLDAASPLKVREAAGGELIAPGGAWLAPGNFHMALARSADGVAIRLHQAPPENSCRPAVDVLFRSVAELYGPTALAVVLTGMGQDGLRGCEAIAAAGGLVLVQDETTSVVWGMPGAVADAGNADAVLPLARIAAELTRLANQGRSRPAIFQPVVSPS